jgi:hypothetical protein
VRPEKCQWVDAEMKWAIKFHAAEEAPVLELNRQDFAKATEIALQTRTFFAQVLGYFLPKQLLLNLSFRRALLNK